MRIIPAILVGFLLACSAPPETALTGNIRSVAIAKEVPQTKDQITLSFAPLVKQAAPAVVNIYTKKIVERRRSPFMNDPFFEKFFGDFFPDTGGKRIENSLGSGVIVDPSGVIVSNYHVVGGADEITVVLQDRREFRAEVIFSDQESDLSVLQLDRAANLPALELRDSDTLEVGDLVLAIGNPFGVGQTVTSGIISALARPFGTNARGKGYFIQTDAAINPGNSGGALVDMSGKLVGVNTAIVSRSGGSNGIGFAIPANLVARVIESASKGLTMLERPWLGLNGQAVTGELAEAMGISRPRGILIDQLHPKSPFASAGLESGDILVAIDDDPINAPTELAFRVATLGTGRSVQVDFVRDGEAQAVSVRLDKAPEQPPREPVTLNGRLSGLTLSNINPAVIEEWGLSLNASGVLVSGVDGSAQRVGFRPGDIVRAVNGQKVTSSKNVSGLTRSGPLNFDVERGGRLGTIRLGS
ncbi:Do family serine endopeptidase [Rhodobacteraceae bacterium NNCM2]|nr:Do family serine endopeptidase [Coraliihabitans acroporae]